MFQGCFPPLCLGRVSENEEFVAFFESQRGIGETSRIGEGRSAKSGETIECVIERGGVGESARFVRKDREDDLGFRGAEPAEHPGEDAEEAFELFRDDEFSDGRKAVEQDSETEWIRSGRIGFTDQDLASLQARGPVDAADGVAIAELAQETEFGSRIGESGIPGSGRELPVEVMAKQGRKIGIRTNENLPVPSPESSDCQLAAHGERSERPTRDERGGIEAPYSPRRTRPGVGQRVASA